MKSFIIHLSKIKESLATATSTKKVLESYNIASTLWEGCYGNQVAAEFEKTGRKLHPWSFKGPTSPIVPGSKYALKNSQAGIKGCFLSHYKLWEHCVKINEPIMIWEDDIVIRRGFLTVDWDDVLILALGHPDKSERYLNYLNAPDLNNPEAVQFSNSSMPGCCGYAIKPHAAKKLIETYKNTYLPADNAINRHHVRLQIHTCIMGIALVEGKKSLTRTRFWDGKTAEQL
jgi:GR25 family glycosyltransferase involved in LPS biosynthesis